MKLDYLRGLESSKTFGLNHVSPRQDADSVILIHGAASSPRIYTDLLQILADTHDIWTFAFPNDQAVRRSAELLEAEMNRVPDQLTEPVLIAHSMGGLVARWYIEKKDGNRRVKALIMLATPNGGSRLASAEMKPFIRSIVKHFAVNPFYGDGSAIDDLSWWEAHNEEHQDHVLNELNNGWEEPPGRTAYYTIAGSHAPLIPPPPWYIRWLSFLSRSKYKKLPVVAGIQWSFKLWIRLFRRYPELFAGHGDMLVAVRYVRLKGVPARVIRRNHVSIVNAPETIQLIKNILRTGHF